MPPLEMCIICDDETGRSGRGDDSLFVELVYELPPFNYHTNDEVGPICSECFDALERLGFI